MTRALSVDLPEDRAEQASAELFEQGAAGVEVRDSGVQLMPGTQAPPPGRALLLAHFPDAGEAERAAVELARSMADVDLRVTLVDVPAVDWDYVWREHFRPVKLSPRLWIRPSWFPPVAEWLRSQRAGGEAALDELASGQRPDEVEIVLDPGMAFGTGGHPTTALCLDALDHELRSKEGEWILDVGTGSGILAIAAIKLGAAGVAAVDVDPVALRVARENALRNGVDPSKVLLDTALPRGGRFALVVANILSETLIELAESIAAQVRPGGVLLLSGILREQADGVASAYQAHGLVRKEGREEGEWVLLRMER